jgi:ribosome-associated protein
MRKTLAKKPAPARKKKSGPPGNRRVRARPPVPRKKASPEPAPVVAPAAIEQPDPSRPRALDVAQAGLDKKAEDVLVLDVRGLTSYADYFVLMTADSDRQAGAIADAVDERLKGRGATKVGVEGYESGRWILIDYGDVVAHVFNRESRSFYDLEGLWADAPRLAVEG